jgi:hypothetical protein
MQNYPLFPQSENYDDRTRKMFTLAYNAACDQLVAVHHLSSAQLGGVIEVMITALNDLYRAGERDAGLLTRYAVSRALLTVKYNEPKKTLSTADEAFPVSR